MTRGVVRSDSFASQEWGHPRSLIVGSYLVLVAGYLLVMTDTASEWTTQDRVISGPVVIAAAAFVWAILVRPRLILFEDEVVIVGWFRTLRFPWFRSSLRIPVTAERSFD